MSQHENDNKLEDIVDSMFTGDNKEVHVQNSHKHHHSHRHSSSRSHSGEHSSRSSSSSRSSGSSSKKKKRSSKDDLNSSTRKKIKVLKQYMLGGWVAVLSILLIVVISWDFEMSNDISDHSDRFDGIVDMVESYVNGINIGSASEGYTIPHYWQEAVDEAAEKVNALLDEAGRDAAVFAWFSDVHYDVGSSNYATGAITAAVMDKCGIPFAVSSGDLLTQTALITEDKVIAAYEAAYEMLAPIGSDRLLQIEGNHDGSWGRVDMDMDGEIEDGEYYKYNLTPEKLYNLMFRQHSTDTRRNHDSTGTWFYIDDQVSKTRFVMLNSVWNEYETEGYNGIAVNNKMGSYGFGQQQLTWFANEALNFDDEGWAVVISAHVPVSQDSIRDVAVMLGICDAFEAGSAYSGSYGEEGKWDHVDISVDYSNKNNGEIVGIYCGHIHKDTIYEEYAYPVITITSNVNSPYDENEEKRVMGTDNEVAVDFVVINRKTGEVNHVRLGVGEDRSYSY